MLTALGIGATTAALAVADHVLLRPLPFRDPDRLIRFQGDDRTRPGGWNDLSPGNYRDLVTRSSQPTPNSKRPRSTWNASFRRRTNAWAS